MTERSLLILSLVALGSAVGGALRFLVSGLVARAVGETFPWGTMSVNLNVVVRHKKRIRRNQTT